MASQGQKIALISVWDKEGILDLAKGLERKGVRMLASGGTERIIQEAGIAVENVSAITGKSSILQGRVKTLHQSVHGGILARDTPEDQSDLANEKIQMIDYVICNLYPFKDTVQKINVTIPEAVEEIDIGGVTLLRAAAKNHARATVVTDPKDYPRFLKELEKGSVSDEIRQCFALKAFEQTASYDTAISEFFRKRYASGTKELALRYGINPHQKPAAAFVTEQERLPLKVLSGAPGYINLLDALNAWPLVKELKEATGLPAAASFKHASPAGAAVGVPMTQEEKEVCMVTTVQGLSESGLAQAYARARGADRVSSFGDVIALSDEVDLPTAKIIGMEVSDGVIAPAYTKEALDILSKKKGGKYLILQVDDTSYEPPAIETRQVYGVSLQQHRNDVKISPSTSFHTVATKSSPPVPESALRDLTVATLALKYTQSNSVCYALNGQTIGLGAGQQSRIHCTRLAGGKADTFWMRFHPRVRELKFKKGVKRPDRSNAIDMLCSGQTGQQRVSTLDQEDYKDNFEALFEDGDVPKPFTPEQRQEWLGKLQNVSLSSDAFFPFTDNVVRAANSGVKYIAAPMGSQADQAVVATAEKAGITFIEQNIRLFHH